MLKLIIPIVFLLVGGGAGVGAGIFLRPEPEPVEVAEPVPKGVDVVSELEQPEEEDLNQPEFVKLDNQFIVPIVSEGDVDSVVIMSLSIEVTNGNRDIVFLREPKLRDSFLYVMFDHANVGGFSGAFTETHKLDILRAALKEVAVRDVGDVVTDVLILEIARQDF